MQVGHFSRLGAAGIDHHQPGAAPRPRLFDALPDHRVAPGGVRSDQQDQVRRVEIVVAARHDIFPERTIVCGDGAGHAQARIGIDVAAADEAFHQLVGDVIVLGQQLARDIESDAVRPVLGDAIAHPARDQIQRVVPTCLQLPDHRMQQAAFKADRLAQMRALRTQLAEIGRMLLITFDPHIARAGDGGGDPAPDTAIGAGGADFLHHRPPRHGEGDQQSWWRGTGGMS